MMSPCGDREHCILLSGLQYLPFHTIIISRPSTAGAHLLLQHGLYVPEEQLLNQDACLLLFVYTGHSG